MDCFRFHLSDFPEKLPYESMARVELPHNLCRSRPPSGPEILGGEPDSFDLEKSGIGSRISVVYVQFCVKKNMVAGNYGWAYHLEPIRVRVHTRRDPDPGDPDARCATPQRLGLGTRFQNIRVALTRGKYHP